MKENTFKYVQFTFQIGLHKDDVYVLEYIMNTFKCGHISRSNNKVNYFVNDLNSLFYIIIPIFNYFNLNSSKYHHFNLFAKAVKLKKENKNLSDVNKLQVIKLKKEMQNMSSLARKWIPNSINDKIRINKFWLAGFIDGEGTFSTNKCIPRFKLENHIKELELYNKIRDFIGTDRFLYVSNRTDQNPTIILEINKIKELKENLIPLMYHDNSIILKTLKSKDFLLWLKLIDMYYKGYHTTFEGKFVFDAIKLHINKYRLTTNNALLINRERISIDKIEALISELYLTESPYELRQNVRYYRNTNKLVSEAIKIVAMKDNYKKIYDSITECAKDINISRKCIKKSIDSGKSYKGYVFVLN